jgi:hypothetical protein
MSRRGKRWGIDKTGRSKGKGQFVPIPHTMAESPAWRTLSGAAVKVYVELRSRYFGGNNGDLSLSLDEGARLLCLGKATVQRALAELTGRGFIRMNRRGRWYGREATTWVVSDRPLGRDPPTNAWQFWKSPVQKQKSVLQRTEKSPDGSATEPKVEPERSATEPVSTPEGPSIGSGMDRLYSLYHAGDGSEGGSGTEGEREAAAPRKEAGGGERDPDRGPQSMSSIIAAMNLRGRI